jgi:hypothetical protein
MSRGRRGDVAMKKVLILLAVLILVGAASWAQGNTGQWLHDLWPSAQKVINHQPTNELETWNGGIFFGFVECAGQVFDAAGLLVLGSVTVGQEVAVVGKYLDDHPERWNLGAEVSVYWALHATWPGKKTPLSEVRTGDQS